MENGRVLGETTINGTFDFGKKLKDNTLIELSHISYKNLIITYKQLTNKKVVELHENTNFLQEITINSKTNKEYLVLKGYFRSYQLDDNIPKSFSEGLVEYFIPLNRGRLKVNVISTRSFKNENIYKNSKLGRKKRIKSGDRTGPPYISTKTILNQEKIKLNSIKENGMIIKENDTVGVVYKDFLNTSVLLDVISPKNKYTKSLLGFKTEFVNLRIKESYINKSKKWNDKSNLIHRSEYRKQYAYYKKNKLPIKIESYHDFYVLEKKYISKKEIKRLETSSFFGARKSSYKRKFWLDEKLKNIPKLPTFIKSLLNTKLIEY